MKRKLKIAQIAPLWFPVPPQKYGGTERIISYLTEGLIKKGHQVTLFGSGDSKTKAKLVSLTKKSLIGRGIPWSDWWWNSFNYSFAFEGAKNFDLIHSHWTPLGFYFQKFTKTPVVHTFHNTPKKDDHRWEIFDYYKNEAKAVFISKSQRENSPIRFKKNWVIYNGIEIEKFRFNPKPKNHFIWIGRISKDKGIENAIGVAKKMGINLILAGQLQPANFNYFEKKVKPHLSSKIRYIGEINQRELSSFYANALAFLYPLEWQEPFGLCMAESMASGTPVIAFDNGSAKEVIKSGKTGFVVPYLKSGQKNIEGLIRAVKKINNIKRADCRNWVEENFSSEKMVENYEKIYYQLVKN